MKKKWIESMDDIKDQYIEEADPNQIVKKKKRKLRTVLIIAACFVLIVSILVSVLAFFGNDMDEFADNPYYDLIVKLETLKKEETASQKDSFWEGTMEDAVVNDSVNSAPPMSDTNSGGSSSGSESYTEVTDNQVSGVTEGDRIKRSNQYIYYLSAMNVLKVYSIDGENSQEVGSYKLNVANGNEKLDSADREIFLSKDCKTVTVMLPIYSFDIGMNCLKILQLDVSNPENIREKNCRTIIGSYESSRSVDGDFLLMTQYRLNWDSVDYDDATTFVPGVITDGKTELVPADSIIMPEKLTDKGYTVVARMDGNTLETVSLGAFLSYSEELYVSAENVFATRQYTRTEEKGNLVTIRTYSEIVCLSYKDKDFVSVGTIEVEGSIKDRYSLDEYKGILRVVTTTSITQYREENNGSYTSSTNWQSNTSANLYCIDVKTMQVKADVNGFAPSGESVQSARYKGNMAYVCTAIVVELTDPVFVFDLSDLSNIQYKETEDMQGFSSSLVDFENGKLLGIGRLDWSTIKIDIYEEGEDSVECTATYTMSGARCSSDYKAYYIDRENQLIGLGITNNGITQYIVLHYDGEKIEAVIRCNLLGNYDVQRGFYADGYFYMCGTNDFQVKELNLNAK